ncbi:hypothetical protein [Paractinoplanes hotanensis]|uniref:Uncharacterized protein n=1 Tax=Paractinoplanes hotanensis TaxID=2906497 RepID=A0ABT0YDI2_9ACTN|nr:hypothetical protein [Actinoplanes hotanensis]MCM4083810.1 hypothetical protein [Actinoplanes hotanensis]
MRVQAVVAVALEAPSAGDEMSRDCHATAPSMRNKERILVEEEADGVFD